MFGSRRVTPRPRRRSSPRRYRLWGLTLGLLLLTVSATPQAEAPAGEGAPTPYQLVPASRDGIGKVYMGREISSVMGYRGAPWLERSSRAREERTDLVVEGMELAPNAVVADIGAGTGYFSLPIARRVPRGRVYAVDVQPEMLEILRQRAESAGVTNLVPVAGGVQDPRLPEGEVDAALLVDAYHEFEYPREMMMAIRRALKPGGKVYLVEYRAEDPRVLIKPLHKMSESQARREMAAVGLEWIETKDFLPQQHFMVFERPLEDAGSP